MKKRIAVTRVINVIEIFFYLSVTFRNGYNYINAPLIAATVAALCLDQPR